MIFNLKASLIIMMTLFLNSCGASQSYHFCYQPPMKGQVIDKKYHDPKGFFSVEAPSSLLKYSIDEGATDPQGSYVSFRYEKGRFDRIETFKNPSDFQIEKAKDKKKLKEVFHKYILGSIKIQRPSTKIIYEEPIGEEGEVLSYFALLYLPEGGSLINNATGKRVDAVKGMLLFFDGDLNVLVSHDIQGFALEKAKNDREDLKQIAKFNLLKIRNSFKAK